MKHTAAKRNHGKDKLSNSFMGKDIKPLFPCPVERRKREMDPEMLVQSRRQSLSESSQLARERVCGWLHDAIHCDCCLSDSGICAFRYNEAVVVVEVPPQNTSPTFFLYSVVCKDIGVGKKDEKDLSEENLIMRKALELNHMQQETKGGCLSLDGNELTLCIRQNVLECNQKSFEKLITNFVSTVSDVRMDIMMARNERANQLLKDAAASKQRQQRQKQKQQREALERYRIDEEEEDEEFSKELTLTNLIGRVARVGSVGREESGCLPTEELTLAGSMRQTQAEQEQKHDDDEQKRNKKKNDKKKQSLAAKVLSFAPPRLTRGGKSFKNKKQQQSRAGPKDKSVPNLVQWWNKRFSSIMVNQGKKQ